MRQFMIAVVCLIVGGAIGAGMFWFTVRHRLTAEPAKHATEKAEAAERAEPPRLSHNDEGETVVRFDTEAQERVGLEVEPLVATTRQPEVTAYGLLQDDPSQTFTLRAPVAGVLHEAETPAWPSLNQLVAANTLFGLVEPRLSATERIDLAARLTQARADAAEAQAALASAQSSYDSKRTLNAEGKAVSDRAMEEAEAKVKSEEARLRAASAIVQLVEHAQAGTGPAVSRFELRTEQAGEVVEIAARPGESVEAGQVLLRLARFDTLIARVEIPLGLAFDPAAPTARILPIGADATVLIGERIGLAGGGTVDARSPTLLYRVPTAGLPLRPGLAVVAYVPAPGGTRSGTIIPPGAVVLLAGKNWVYVQESEESFARRELAGAEFIGDAWFGAHGFQAGDRVVTVAAQDLLSEELKPQIEQAAEASE